MDELRLLLENANNKHSLDLAMNRLLEIIENDRLAQLDSMKPEICELFRDKLYSVITQGDMPNKLYLSLYGLFDGIKEDDRFARLSEIGKQGLFDEGVSDNENIMLIELVCLAKILLGKPDEGLSFYLQNIMRTDIHCIEAQRSSEFILSFFKYLHIPFERYRLDLEVVLKQTFHSLTYKQKRSVFNWQLHVFWNIKHFYNHKGWLELYDTWRDIFYAELAINSVESIDFAMYLQFFIYHLCGNNFSSQKEWLVFNKEITDYASNFYMHFGKTHHLAMPTQDKKPKKVLAILRDRMVENSPHKVEYSFLKSLMNNKEFCQNYELKVYIMSLVEKSDNDPRLIKNYQDLGIEVIDIGLEHNQALYYNSHLAKALALRERMINDGIDLLVSPNNGYGISDFLLATRTAKKQIFWSHGNFVYDSPFIDLKITHICGNEKQIIHEGHRFYGIPVKMDSVYYNPVIPDALIEKERLKYPKDALILGVIGRLVKIDTKAYLEVVAKILKESKNAIFLACGIGNEQEIKEKIREIDEGLLNRFYFPGFVDSGIYGHIIDIWLDSFPMEQGESRIEYAAKNRPSLVLAKEDSDSRLERLASFYAKNEEVFRLIAKQNNQDLEELKEFFLQDISLVAFSQNEYIKKALALIDEIRNNPEKMKLKMHLQASIKAVNDFLKERDGVNNFIAVLGQEQ